MITISDVTNEHSMAINNPEWGYSVSIGMSIKKTMSESGKYSFWDNTASACPDTRILECSFLLTESQQWYFDEYFLNPALLRNSDCVLTLGLSGGTYSNSGFYPAGPDYGSYGKFRMRLLPTVERSGRLTSPWGYFRNKCQFVYVTKALNPSVLPTIEPMGNFSIGTVDYLLWPQLGINPEFTQKTNAVLTNSGMSYIIDGNNATDRKETKFTVEANTSLAAALTAHLVSTSGRASDIEIVAPSNMFLFGMLGGDTGTYTTKLLTNPIVITHDRHDGFSIPLSFWMKSLA